MTDRYFEDDVFAWGKRAREDAMTPTGFEGAPGPFLCRTQRRGANAWL